MNDGSAAATPVVALRGAGKSFPGVVALDDVDLEVHAGTIHALLGENGAGKSTLIHLLGGVLRPDRGQLLVHGREVQLADARAARAQGIAVFHQEADLFPDLTVAENVALEHGWPRRAGVIAWGPLRRTTAAALADLGRPLAPTRLAAGLSAAERQLVGLAAALSQPAALLILDEPTSSLSAEESQVLFARLRDFRARGGAVLYVSHRLEELFALADVVTILRDGRRVWSGPLVGTSREQLITWMVGRELRHAPAVGPAAPGPVRLRCADLTAGDGSFRDVTLEVRAGEVVGLYGLIGAGRTEWAQAILGLRPLAGGTVAVDGAPWQPSGPGQAARRGLAYLPEDRLRLGLCGGLSVRANAVLAALRRLAAGPFVSAGVETQQTQALVQQLAVRLRSVEQPARTLSGGNQQKVVLGRGLACEPGTLLLDEPTRGVDVRAKAEIHALLRRLAAAGRAIVLISSDLAEVLACSDRIGVFRDGRCVALHPAHTATAEQVAADALPQAAADEAQPAGAPARASASSEVRGAWLREAGLLLAVLLAAAVLAWRTDTFWRAGTLRDVAENAALLALCGLAAGLVLLAGGIDISFGALMALGAAVAGHLLREGWPPGAAVAACLGVTAAAGGLNAGLALAGGVHPIVVTLGTMSVYRGLTLLLIGGQAIHDVPAAFRAPLLAAPLGVPSLVWLVLLLLTAAWLVLGWTVPGRQVLALGSNPAAARRTGIHPGRVWMGVFTCQGLLAGLGGLLALGLAGHLQATDFEEKTLEAIGVAVVGGVAITGGRGSVWGVCAAALLFRVLEKGWILLAISSYWQRTIVGTLLLLAILADRLWRHRQGEPPA